MLNAGRMTNPDDLKQLAPTCHQCRQLPCCCIRQRPHFRANGVSEVRQDLGVDAIGIGGIVLVIGGALAAARADDPPKPAHEPDGA